MEERHSPPPNPIPPRRHPQGYIQPNVLPHPGVISPRTVAGRPPAQQNTADLPLPPSSSCLNFPYLASRNFLRRLGRSWLRRRRNQRSTWRPDSPLCRDRSSTSAWVESEAHCVQLHSPSPPLCQPLLSLTESHPHISVTHMLSKWSSLEAPALCSPHLQDQSGPGGCSDGPGLDS